MRRHSHEWQVIASAAAAAAAAAAATYISRGIRGIIKDVCDHWRP